jgi:hypothetical protein
VRREVATPRIRSQWRRIAKKLLSGVRVGFVSLAIDALLLIATNRLIDFVAVNRDFLRSFHSQADLVPTDFHDDDCNVIVDDNTFVLLA